jgi:hypothetical protein
MVYIPQEDGKNADDEEDDENDKEDIEIMETMSLNHSSDGALDFTDFYDSILTGKRGDGGKRPRKKKRTVSYSKRVCAPRNIHVSIG